MRNLIKNNYIILFLDGVDEIPDKKLKNEMLNGLIADIREYRELYKSKIKVVATTRPHGYTEEFDTSKFLHLNIMKLSPEIAYEYTKKWLQAKKYDDDECQRIIEKFEMCLKDKVINVLTTTPLQVTIVLVIIRARGILPKQREELFDTYMETIYQREQKKNTELIRTEKETIIGLHKYIAYLLQDLTETDETATLMNESEFKNQIVIYIKNDNPILSHEEVMKKASQLLKKLKKD